jgi:hypothetical protein
VRTRRAPPLKLEKIWFFGVKLWFFTRNTSKFFAPPSARRIFFKCAPPNLKSWIRPCIKIDYAVSKYSHIFTCLRQTITWFISRVNISYQDVTFNKHTSKGHSILLNNTSRRINCVSTFKKIYSFLFSSICLYINSKLNQIADFYSKIQNNFYITKGRVTWHMYEYCNFIWIYSRFLFY